MKHLTLLIAAAAVVSGCSGSGSGKPQLSENTTIDVAGALAATEDLKVSDLGSKIHYIPLETNDSSLIGDRMAVKAEKDLIIFYPSINFGNATNPLPAFSINDGTFKGLIGHSGQDPEAFRYPTPCISSDGNNVYFINPNWAIAGYNADGMFDKIYDTPARLALGYVNDKTVGAIEKAGAGQRISRVGGAWPDKGGGCLCRGFRCGSCDGTECRTSVHQRALGLPGQGISGSAWRDNFCGNAQ